MKSRMFTADSLSLPEMLDERTLAAARILLIAVALLGNAFSSDRPFLARADQAAAACYLCYSIALYAAVLRKLPLAEAAGTWLYWFDALCYMGLIALSQERQILFFVGLLVAVMTAAFRWGYISELRLTAALALCIAMLDFAVESIRSEYDLTTFVLHALQFAVVGWLVVHWGRFGRSQQRQIGLLKAIAGLANPRAGRAGVDRTMGRFLERLRAFYDADACLLVSLDQLGDDYTLRRAERENLDQGMIAERIPEKFAQQLLELPSESSLIYSSKIETLREWLGDELSPGAATPDMLAACVRLSALLDAATFASIPLRLSNQPAGRLYLIDRRRRAFVDLDLGVLTQAVKHALPIIDNVRLFDRLAADVATEERRRIAHDLHDSVIQSYIGLQMGLAAIRQKSALGKDISQAVAQMIQLTETGIADLRAYVRELRYGSSQSDGLVPAIGRLAEKFSGVTGIAVELQAIEDIDVEEQIAAEVFQIVAEGLSNIRRHSQAEHAIVKLMRQGKALIVRLENDGAHSGAAFVPRSITERAATLGGFTRVGRGADNHTVVSVEIPL